MDGAFSSDDCIKKVASASKAIYTSNEIYTDKPKNIILRNQRKRENLDRICLLSKVCGIIPYKCYYMSCNLDHVLHNKQNSSDEEKEKDAYAFAKKYRNNLTGFIDFILNSNFSITEDFRKSWQFIKEDKHSLERYSNFGICFKNMTEILDIYKTE